MKKNELSTIFQFSGFLYYKPKSGNVIGLYPTDLFMGSIINRNSKDHGLDDLIYPYSVEELKKALKAYGRDRVLNAKILELNPSKEEALKCKEFNAVVSSMSDKEKTHKSLIRNIFDPTRVEFRCSCGKKLGNRDTRGIWHPILKIEWPQILDGKHYLEAVCPHISALKYGVLENYEVRVFGFDDGLSFMKPYLFAYIDILKTAPKFRDYTIDFVMTWYSSMFDKVKEQVNKMRNNIGLGSLDMYDMKSVRKYAEYMLVKGGYNRSKLNEVIEIAKSI
jgi:hypothetical protein